MQNRKKAPAGMYTAREAIAKIGVPSTNFYKLVKAGTIKSVTLPGRKEAFYPKVEIDRYARVIQSYIDQYNDQTLTFGLAIKEDIPEIRNIVAEAVGGYERTIPQEILEAWIRKNPESIHVLRRGAELIGYISILPLPLDTILDRLAGKLMNRTIPIDDIQPFAPNKTLILYVAEAAAKQSLPNRLRIGGKLMQEAMNFLITLAQQQKTFAQEIYAVGTTPFGIRACRSLGFEELDIPEGTRPDRIPFKLDVTNSKSLLVSKYKKAVESLQISK